MSALENVREALLFAFCRIKHSDGDHIKSMVETTLQWVREARLLMPDIVTGMWLHLQGVEHLQGNDDYKVESILTVSYFLDCLISKLGEDSDQAPLENLCYYLDKAGLVTLLLNTSQKLPEGQRKQMERLVSHWKLCSALRPENKDFNSSVNDLFLGISSQLSDDALQSRTEVLQNIYNALTNVSEWRLQQVLHLLPSYLGEIHTRAGFERLKTLHNILKQENESGRTSDSAQTIAHYIEAYQPHKSISQRLRLLANHHKYGSAAKRTTRRDGPIVVEPFVSPPSRLEMLSLMSFQYHPPRADTLHIPTASDVMSYAFSSMERFDSKCVYRRPWLPSTKEWFNMRDNRSTVVSSSRKMDDF